MLASGSFSLTRWACLAVYMQHTREQYSLPRFLSLEPTQWMNTTSLGSWPFMIILPWVGPEAEESRSNSRPVMTLS